MIFSHLRNDRLEIGAVFIHAADKTETGNFTILCVFPGTGGSDLGTIDGVHENDCSISGADGGDVLSDKLTVSRSINEEKVIVFPFAVERCGINTCLTGLFVGHIVTDGILCINASDTPDGASFSEKLFTKGGFSAPGVPGDDKIPAIYGVGHNSLLCFLC